MVKAHVITAGPHSGKTALVDELAKRGYNSVPEAARDIIAMQQQYENGILPWTNLVEFQDLVLTEQLKREAPYENQEYFTDRGIFDGQAYLTEAGISAPNWMQAIYEKNLRRYDKIFILDPIPGFKQDAQRKEDPERGIALTSYIQDTYKEYGFEIIQVPVFEGTKEESIRKRADFVLENIL